MEETEKEKRTAAVIVYLVLHLSSELTISETCIYAVSGAFVSINGTALKELCQVLLLSKSAQSLVFP